MLNRSLLARLAVFLCLAAAVPLIGGTARGDLRQTDRIDIGTGGHQHAISLTCPEFVFEGETVGSGVGPMSATGSMDSPAGMNVTYPRVRLHNGCVLVVKMTVRRAGVGGIVSKWARYMLLGGRSDVLLREIVLDRIDIGDESVWTHGGHAGPANRFVETGSIQSFPVFSSGFFAGIEFPIASTRVEGKRIVLAHRPGIRLQPGVWYESRKAVYGVAAAGQEAKAFESYIISHGRAIRALHVNYNSWWTTTVPFTEAQVIDIADAFTKNLREAHGERLDSLCIDMGWSKLDSIWEIDPAMFPTGFGKADRAVRKTGAHLGIWFSPSSAYPGALNNEWARKQGYEVFDIQWQPGLSYICLAGARYSEALSAQLTRLIKTYGLRQVKTDGLVMWCFGKDHGHEPGDLSSEPVAQGLISLYDAVHRASPDVIIEPFGLGYDPSPWWLLYTDEMLTCQGDDSPPARVPCPVGRESITSARDYFVMQAAALNPSPICAQEAVGLIHQTPEDFMNDGVTVLLRGHLFFPLYVNPKEMNPGRWSSLAELIRWGRRNDQVLRETTPLLPASWQKGGVARFTDDGVMPRETYGYAHFAGEKGLIHLRNPWIAPQTYRVTLDGGIGVAGSARGISAVSVYPEVRLYAKDLRYGDTIDVPLAPYETLVLSLRAGQPTNGLKTVPGDDRPVQAVVTAQSFDRVDFDPSVSQYMPSSTGLVGDAASHVRMRLDAQVDVKAPTTKLLVLLEGDSDLSTPYGVARVDGKDLRMTSIPSSGIWTATGLKPREHWTFLEAALPSGKYPVSLEVLAGDDCKRMSAWIWASRPGHGKPSYPNALPEPENVSLDSVRLAMMPDASSIGATAERIERPTEKIEGIFLDTLEPVSVEQGWGILRKNISVWEKPMSIAGRPFLRGLGTHANSRIVYALDGKYSRFQSWVGGDYAHYPTITFEVWVDGSKRWESGLMTRSDEAKRVDIDVSGASRLELAVGNGGDGISGDHADWADARLIR